MNNNWISDLKIGDSVYTIERNIKIPNGFYRWESKVTQIRINYIETSYARDFNLEWLLELCKDLAPYHRTFEKVREKKYYMPNGNIDIEKMI